MGLAVLRSRFWSCYRAELGAMMLGRLSSGRDGRGRNRIAEIVRRSSIGHGRGCGYGGRNVYLAVHVGSPQYAETSWSRLFVEG
jgi:hypothetical protein